MGSFTDCCIFTIFKMQRQQSWGLGLSIRTWKKNTASGHRDFALKSDWCFWFVIDWSAIYLPKGNKNDCVFQQVWLTIFLEQTFTGEIIIRFGNGCTCFPTTAIIAALMTSTCAGSHWTTVPWGSLYPEGCSSSSAAHT